MTGVTGIRDCNHTHGCPKACAVGAKLESDGPDPVAAVAARVTFLLSSHQFVLVLASAKWLGATAADPHTFFAPASSPISRITGPFTFAILEPH